METGKERLEAIFAAALDLTSTAQREVYLARVCAEDPALRAEIEALLEAYEKAGQFLLPENDPLEPVSVSEPEVPTVLIPVTETAGDRIGRYKLIEKIGEGGCGVV